MKNTELLGNGQTEALASAYWKRNYKSGSGTKLIHNDMLFRQRHFQADV